MKNIIEEIYSHKNPVQVKVLAKFFQTQNGGYGEGDCFLGIKVPVVRLLVKKYQDLELTKIDELMKNKYHEIRLFALLLLVRQYNCKKCTNKDDIYRLYLKNADYINNWDLVDLTAYHIVGAYCYECGNDDKIRELAHSGQLWRERIAILSSFYHIKQGRYDLTVSLCKEFLTHKHHLIHKATGWLLREIGKRDKSELKKFLDENCTVMPRTMLRYAIERLDKDERTYYMQR